MYYYHCLFFITVFYFKIHLKMITRASIRRICHQFDFRIDTIDSQIDTIDSTTAVLNLVVLNLVDVY
jgi:hypothetical protein